MLAAHGKTNLGKLQIILPLDTRRGRRGSHFLASLLQCKPETTCERQHAIYKLFPLDCSIKMCCHPLPIPPTGCWVRLTQPSRALQRIAPQRVPYTSLRGCLTDPLVGALHIPWRATCTSTYNHDTPDLMETLRIQLALDAAPHI